MERAEAPARPILPIKRTGQAQGAGLYGRNARIGRLHLGDRPTGQCARSLQRMKEPAMNVKCVGSRMDNGERTLESTIRHSAMT